MRGCNTEPSHSELKKPSPQHNIDPRNERTNTGPKPISHPHRAKQPCGKRPREPLKPRWPAPRDGRRPQEKFFTCRTTLKIGQRRWYPAGLAIPSKKYGNPKTVETGPWFGTHGPNRGPNGSNVCHTSTSSHPCCGLPPQARANK